MTQLNSKGSDSDPCVFQMGVIDFSLYLKDTGQWSEANNEERYFHSHPNVFFSAKGVLFRHFDADLCLLRLLKVLCLFTVRETQRWLPFWIRRITLRSSTDI